MKVTCCKSLDCGADFSISFYGIISNFFVDIVLFASILFAHSHIFYDSLRPPSGGAISARLRPGVVQFVAGGAPLVSLSTY